MKKMIFVLLLSAAAAPAAKADVDQDWQNMRHLQKAQIQRCLLMITRVSGSHVVDHDEAPDRDASMVKFYVHAITQNGLDCTCVNLDPHETTCSPRR